MTGFPDRFLTFLFCLILAAGLTSCSDDSSPVIPDPVPAWSNDALTWTAPFAADGVDPSTLKYCKSGDVVFLKGLANAGSTKIRNGQVICTLPDGYRPAGGKTRVLLCPTWGRPADHEIAGSAGVMVAEDGSIRIKTVHQFDAQQQFLSFDSVSFSASPAWSQSGITWTAPYSDDGGGSSLAYDKTGDLVRLSGMANAGGTRVRAGQNVCTLPEECRPPSGMTRFFLCPTWGWPTGYPTDGYVGIAGVFIFDTGTVHVKTVQQFDGQQQFLIFDSVSFSTTQAWSTDDIAWTPPFSAGGTYSSSFQYTRTNDRVCLQGAANAGGIGISAGQEFCILPEGYRPPAVPARLLLCPTWGWPTGHETNGYVGSAGVFVRSDGRILIKTVLQFDGQQQFLMFDSKCFSNVD